MISLRAILVIVTVLLVIPLGRVVGQVTIPADAITATDLTDAHKDIIKRAIEASKAGLTGKADETKNEIKKSRNALLDPFLNAGVSVPFRLYYSEQLGSVLQPLVTSEREIVAINALRIAGELATTKGVEILSAGLKDTRPGVRFAAVTGFSSTFSAIERQSPAIARAAQASSTLATLKTSMAKETDAKVLEAYALALSAGSKVPTKKLEGLRGDSVSTMAEAMGTKAQAATDGKYDAAFRRAANAARIAVTAQDINEPELTSRVLRDAAGMAGDFLSLVARRVKGGELSVGVLDEVAEAALKKKRSEFVLLVADSERTIQWAGNGLGAPDAKDHKLSDLLQSGKDEVFMTEVMRLIGANGSLTAEPFGFADTRFVK